MKYFYDLLYQIKKKPGLYIGNPSIENLYMFLTGYSFARRELNVSPSAEENEFRQFQPWLQKKFNLKTSQSWSQIILSFTLNEEDGFKRFFELFEEFTEEQHPSSDNFTKHAPQVIETVEVIQTA